jgi:CDP-ribitol ribitolphosphotransferase
VRAVELAASSAVLRACGRLSRVVPVRRDRVVLLSVRADHLTGNLEHLDRALARLRPEHRRVALTWTYRYSLAGRLQYLLRAMRGTYHLTTSATVFVDNAYLPVDVVPRRPGVTVVQVWHAAGALKKFGRDAVDDGFRAEDAVLHSGYDYVVASSEVTADHYATAFGTPRDRVLALGCPRAEALADPAWVAASRESVRDRHPELRGRRVLLYASTFRGRGVDKEPGPRLDGAALRAALPPEWCLVLKPHPVVAEDPEAVAGFDVVITDDEDLNELMTAADVLLSDYSSAVFEWAVLDRPLLLFVPDLESYERSPGLYLDLRTEMIGRRVKDAADLAAAVLALPPEPPDHRDFVLRHLGADLAAASDRVVERFVPR